MCRTAMLLFWSDFVRSFAQVCEFVKAVFHFVAGSAYGLVGPLVKGLNDTAAIPRQPAPYASFGVALVQHFQKDTVALLIIRTG